MTNSAVSVISAALTPPALPWHSGKGGPSLLFAAVGTGTKAALTGSGEPLLTGGTSFFAALLSPNNVGGTGFSAPATQATATNTAPETGAALTALGQFSSAIGALAAKPLATPNAAEGLAGTNSTYPVLTNDVLSRASALVQTFNQLSDKLNSLAAVQGGTQPTSADQLLPGLNNTLYTTYTDGLRITSLDSIGIQKQSDGTLALNPDTLAAAFAASPLATLRTLNGSVAALSQSASDTLKASS